jgi:hypothetical protein
MITFIVHGHHLAAGAIGPTVVPVALPDGVKTAKLAATAQPVLAAIPAEVDVGAQAGSSAV